MSANIPLWRTTNCCYAHEQCISANEQWLRLLGNMTAQNGKGSILQHRTSIDPCLIRLINGAELSPVSSTLSECSQGDKICNDPTLNCRVVRPWKSDEEKRYLPGLEGFDEEIEDFFRYITPLPEEAWMRHDLVLRITQLITELWPAAKVEVFGSYATGLYLPTSDIDVVVMYWEIDAQTPEVMQKALMTLEKQLINKGAYDDVKVIRTSVPIIKFTDRETAVKVDVGFNVSTGAQSVQFIKEKMLEFPQLRCLIFVLKQFLVYHNLLESFNGGISSYCLILLIVSYLQLNCSDENVSYGQHVIRFLELYGCHFNYLRTGIRIRDGGSYFPKNDPQDGESENRYQFSLLYIEDPLNAANDVGKGCYGAMKVRDAFANAYRDLRDAVLPQYRTIQLQCSTLLGRILDVPLEIVQYRRLISQRHARLTNSMIYPIVDDRSSMTSGVIIATDDRSDCGSVSSQTSNVSSLTKSSQCQSQSTGSAAISDNESEVNGELSKQYVVEQQSSRSVQQQSMYQLGEAYHVPMTSLYTKTSHSTEPPHSAVRTPRPSTLYFAEQQSACRPLVSVAMVTAALPIASPAEHTLAAASCTLTTVTQSKPAGGSLPVATSSHGYFAPRQVYSNYVVRPSNGGPPRGLKGAASQGSGAKTTVVTSLRSPGGDRYSKSNSNSGNAGGNVNCVNGR